MFQKKKIYITVNTWKLRFTSPCGQNFEPIALGLEDGLSNEPVVAIFDNTDAVSLLLTSFPLIKAVAVNYSMNIATACFTR